MVTIPEKLVHLENAGVTLERLQREYNDGATFTDLEKIFQPEVSVKVDRKVFSAIWNDYGLRRRTSVEDLEIRNNRLRTSKRKHYPSEGKVVELYQEGWSIKRIREKFNTTSSVIRNILVTNDVEIRQQINVKSIIQDIENNGLTVEKIIEVYIHQNHDHQSTADFVQTFTKYFIFKKTLQKILKHYNLVKPPELIKDLQGRKSRGEKAVNMQKLSTTGFDSPQEVADYYFANKHLTKTALVGLLNSRLDDGDELFTMRWIERHVHPLIPEERRYGVSRVEREMVHFLEQCFPNIELVQNTRGVITPYELDVYFPKLKLAIEFNGDYWHSDKFLVPNHGMTAVEYHRNKFDLSFEKGVFIAFVWECDWLNKPDVVQKSLIDFVEHRMLDDCLGFVGS